MKLTLVSLFCLSLILCGAHFSLAKKGGGGGFGKGGGFGRSGGSKTSWFSKGSSGTKYNTGQKSNQGSSSQGRNRKQPGDYPRQYPMQGSPQGGFTGPGSFGGGYGGSYPGGYMNFNPNNRILSPRLGGSYGYGGYGGGGGSLFSQSVQQMGVYPDSRSMGFGRTAVMAAAGGAVTGMALGYGLGRFPRPHFHFHSPQEQYYYNHCMYRRYGTRSTDTNDYSRDYKYKDPPNYDRFMDSCMKRSDIPPAENLKPAATIPDAGKVNNSMNTNIATESSSTSALLPQQPVNQDQTNPEDDDDTVSIMEIGYPALIEQIKARWCLDLYMIESEKYLVRNTAGTKGPGMGTQGFLAVISSTILMLLNSNMLTLY